MMAASPLYELINCPHCRAVADAVVGRCWLCGGRLDASPKLTRTRRSEAQSSAEQSIGQSNSVAPVVLSVVLIGVLLIAPGLGLLVAIFAGPALLRGRGEESVVFRVSRILSIVGLVLFAVFIAAFIACMVTISGVGKIR